MSKQNPKNSPSMRPFFILWTGQAVSLLGSQLVQFALIWWLTQETGSATMLALATLIGLLPQIVLGPFVGVLVDRWNRRLTMLFADVLVAVATMLLAYLFSTGIVEIWHVYLLLFIRSLGAFLLAILPLQGIMAIDVVTACFAIVPLLLIHVPQPARKTGDLDSAKPTTSYWNDLREGLRYVVARPALIILMGLAMLVNLVLPPVFSLIPLLVSEHFNGTAWHFGGIEADVSTQLADRWTRS